MQNSGENNSDIPHLDLGIGKLSLDEKNSKEDDMPPLKDN